MNAISVGHWAKGGGEAITSQIPAPPCTQSAKSTIVRSTKYNWIHVRVVVSTGRCSRARTRERLRCCCCSTQRAQPPDPQARGPLSQMPLNRVFSTTRRRPQIMRALSGRLIECSTVPPKGVQRGSVLELLYLNEQHSFMSVLHHLFAFVLECRKPMHDAQSSS